MISPDHLDLYEMGTLELLSAIILCCIVAKSAVWKTSSLFGTKYSSCRRAGSSKQSHCRIHATRRTSESDSDHVVAVIGGGAAGVFSAIQCAQFLSTDSNPQVSYTSK